MAASDAERAVGLARTACAMSPDPEIGWRRLMAVQQRVGDLEGALRTFDELSRRLRQELDTEPAIETVALARQIRLAPAPEPGATRQSSVPNEIVPPTPVAEAASINRTGRKRGGIDPPW